MVLLLLSFLIGVVAYVGTTPPDLPADNLPQLIHSLGSDICSAYKVNHYGETILTHCHGF
jgi:hypothetical protein